VLHRPRALASALSGSLATYFGTIGVSYDTISTIVKLAVRVITGMQIRASRAALRWSAEVLAARAKVGVQTIKRLEATDGVPLGRSKTLQEVQLALERAGIEFVGTPLDRPGIRFSNLSTSED
jgi:hypothetical protein